MNDTLDPRGQLGPTDVQIARMRSNVRATIAAEQTRTRRRRGWAIGGSLSLLVIVAGGTSAAMAAGVLQAPSWFVAAPAPAPTATHEPVSVTTPTPSATPTSTPTTSAEPAGQFGGKPTVREPLGCSDLVPATALTAALGSNVQPGPDASANIYAGSTDALPGLIADDAGLALGALECSWNDPSTVSQVVVTVTPLDSFDTTTLDPRDGFGKVSTDPALGPDASVWINDGGLITVSAPVNGSMLTVSAYGGGPGTDAKTTAMAVAQAAFQQVQAAPAPRPAYSAAGGLSTDCAAFAQAVTAKPGTGVLTGNATSPYAVLNEFPFTYLGGLDCKYAHTAADGSGSLPVRVLYLPGGAWDWARVSAGNTGALKLAATTGLGGTALTGCVSNTASPFGVGFCEADVQLDGSWLDVQVDTTDQTAALAIAKSVSDEVTELAN